MSDLGIANSETSAIFRPATIGLMILVGLVGFFGALVLSSYAPDLQGESHPGGHAASRAATGFSGLVDLTAATGRNPQVLRDERLWTSEDLVVATPESAATNLGKILAARGTSKATLFILPKWDAAEDKEHKGWVRIAGLLPAYQPEGVFAPGLLFDIKRHLDKSPALRVDPALPGTIRFVTPGKLQVIERPARRSAASSARSPVEPGSDQPRVQGPPTHPFDYTFDNIRPLITDGAGGIVLGQIDNMYILADPDLLDNAGMKQFADAASAVTLLDWMNSTGAKSVGFDVVLNGLGGSKSLLRLAFDPPMLAMTLTLAAMVLLLGIRAAGRFGAPRPRARAIAFGKTALVDNGALLVRKAGKARRLGGRYAAAIREQAVLAFGVSPRLKAVEVDRYLDALGGAVPFTVLAEAAEAANSDSEMLAAAQALHAWKREIVSDD